MAAAATFFCAALITAVIVIFTDYDRAPSRREAKEPQGEACLKDEEPLGLGVEVGVAGDAARTAGKALHGTVMTVEASGISRVGDLEEVLEEAGEEAQAGEGVAVIEEALAEAVEAIAETPSEAGEVTEEDGETIEDDEVTEEAAEEPQIISLDEIDPEDLPSDNSVVLGSSVTVTSHGITDWKKAVMADVEEYLNVRCEPDADSALAGRMERGDVGTVIEVKDGWVYMESGELCGYMKEEYCVMGDDVMDYARKVCDVVATTTTSGLRVRRGPSKEDGIIRTVEKGYKLVVAGDDAVEDEYDTSQWLAVKSGSGIGFVAREYVDISWDIGTGITKEEMDAIQREKEEAARRGKASTNTDDLILLASLIQGEGNGQPYEGKVAIANVVLNRVNSGAYPNSIYNVIYQPGQFGPAGSGKVAQIVLYGPSKANKEAAAAALGGLNYIGGVTHFKSVYSGMQGTVIGSHVFY